MSTMSRALCVCVAANVTRSSQVSMDKSHENAELQRLITNRGTMHEEK